MTVTDHEHPVWVLLDQIQMDLRQLQGRVVALRGLVAQVPLESTRPDVVCPDCPESFRSRHLMESHRYLHHDGPLPELDRIASQRAEGDT